ncbi:hypothetical protein MSG28_007544 [Choristoneura fumiferana]|uniref:Uncharacterized protein n=1 Tax=Choristoneura fumiferana TaxID=7141 RepID=A0ACC0JY83_CHOFU|nr:hypothetical protein MSG28_007544 [Choristoneura fumiferana]
MNNDYETTLNEMDKDAVTKGHQRQDSRGQGNCVADLHWRQLDRRLRAIEQPSKAKNVCRCDVARRSLNCWRANLATLSADLLVPSDLVTIDLGTNKLRTLHKTTFKGMRSLSELDMFDNHVEYLPAGIFDSLVNLRILRLQRNYLEEIDSETFRSSKKLFHVDLSNNFLYTLPEKLFANNSLLETVDISNNQVIYIPSDSFIGLDSLRVLDLSNNKIQQIENGTFFLRTLRILKFSENRIVNITENAFEDLISLETLLLDKNNLQNIPERLLRKLNCLSYLDLSENNLQSLKGVEFENLKQLRNLDLKGNSLTVLPDYTFANCSSLEKLDLSKNKMQFLNVTTFHGLNNLASLILSENKLYEVHFKTFSTLRNLTTLYLDSNMFPSLPSRTLDYMPKLAIIKLSGNPWHCDCHTLYISAKLKFPELCSGQWASMVNLSPRLPIQQLLSLNVSVNRKPQESMEQNHDVTTNFQININDNNNNNPLWKTEGSAASLATTYDFTIATPVAPGFPITDCVRQIIVRDVDLTNYAINFGIEDNPYFEIGYDEASSTVDKEYKATLRTTTFLRSIPGPLVLRISATTISLQQGYDSQVQFSLEGDYAEDHFDIVVNGNEVSLVVTNPMPTQNLEFERPHYEGEIVDNALQLTQLILRQGYQDSTLTITVEDYPSFFTAATAGNIITLSMTPLNASIIEANNFINLRVTASTDYSAATTIVTLEIIKDDIETPLFGRSLYSGMYDNTTGLTLEPLLLTQGYDDTVQVTFSGEHEDYFELVRNGASSTLRVVGGGLPSNIWSEQRLLLTIVATKPRTVGASTVVSIALPELENLEFEQAHYEGEIVDNTLQLTQLILSHGYQDSTLTVTVEARELGFEAPSYRGSLQDNILTLEIITLSVGYGDDVTFTLSGDYSSFFSVSSVQNQVTINPPTQLPQEVISENNFLMFTVTADGLNALPTSTAVLLEIIKDDVTTPVFSQAIYYGNYLGSLDIDIGNMNLAQGYDSSVSFRIEGENSQYFQIIQNANSVTLTVLTAIPEDLIFSEKSFVFNIFADKPLTVGANAAIFVRFSQDLTEPALLQFGRHTYIGSVEKNIMSLENIVLESGFAPGTSFHLTGDYSSLFTPTIENNVIYLSLSSELSAEVLENNKFLILELEARRDRAVPVSASIIIDLVEEETPIIPVFNQAFYTGIYTAENILRFEETISLLQGYDETVTFSLEGESSEWFTLVSNGNSVTLVTSSNVPQDVVDTYHQLLFTVIASKPNTINGESAISIDLPKVILEQEVLRFDQSHYEGRVSESDLQVPTILLVNEITDNIELTMSGNHSEYFSISRQLNIIHIELVRNIPAEVISNNEFLIFEISASKADAVRGYTTLILRIDQEPQIISPVFEQAYYSGEYSEQSGLIFEHTLRLIQGYDETVQFALQGDSSEWFILTQTEPNSLTLSTRDGSLQQLENINHLVFSVLANKPGSIPGEAAIIINLSEHAQWFTLVVQGNSVTLTTSGAIPPAVIANNQQLVFVITADKPNSNTARATIIISLVDDLSNYFNIVQQGSSVSIVLQAAIPEQSIPANRIVLLELRATSPGAIPAVTAVVFEVVREDDVALEELVFSAPYYTGQFSEAGGLVFETAISLDEGYDQNVQFALDGEHAQWFTLVVQGNSVTLTTSGAIPPAVIANNQQLVFVITADKPNSNTARATIVISLVDDLSNYFNIVQQGSSVSIVLQAAIPEQSIPANRIVLLELRATSPGAIPAVTAVVFEVVREDDVALEELVFSAPYYTGQFSEAGGLVFETAISLDEGYDQNVQFALDGEHAQWFTLVVQGNSVTLTTSGAIPPAVIANNQQLVFVITAEKPNSNTARATIVISLVDDLSNYFNIVQQGSSVSIVLQAAIPEQSIPANRIVLLELRATSPGAIPAVTAVVFEVVREDDVALEELVFSAPYYTGQFSEAGGLVFETAISLDEGYDQNVQFALDGEHAQWFTLVVQGNSVTLTTSGAIPPAVIANNQQLVFVITADKPNSNTARATIVISLVDDLSNYFNIVQQGSSVSIVLQAAIPEQSIPANRIVLLELRATSPGAIPAVTAVVFEVVREDDVALEELVFSAPYYTGQFSEAGGLVFETAISLDEGYDQNVQFALDGEHAQWFTLVVQGNTVTLTTSGAIPPAVIANNQQLVFVITAEKPNSNTARATIVISLVDDLSNYFNIVQQGPSVSIVLQAAIPEQSIPANRIVLLELRATSPGAIPAVTAVVFEVVREDDVALEELVFSAPYYTGQFSEAGGLVFETAISLDEGYDQNVQFALDGEHAQWFTLVVQGNSVTLTTSGAIPPAVIANNQQLVFVITAEKPNSNTARATIVISLVDDLSNYFNIVQQGSSVSIVLQAAIPEQSIPANRIVLLELRATSPGAIPAVTAVVFEVVREDDVALEELVFSAPYYTGQFSEAGGLVFETAISLDEGYDQNVQFALDGEHAQWFTLVVQGNSVTLTTSGAIPPAVIANNQQLVFVITAEKPNSNTARATIVISLVDDLSNYFNIVQQGSSVSIVLQAAIPEQSIPANRIVLLELRATSPGAIPAVTAVVFEVVREDDVALEELVFSAPYYTGQFSEAGGLVFETAISLDEGYDQNVQFGLDGEHAQWFTLVVQGNSVTLTTSGAIPPAVIANNQQLVFVITAEKPNSNTARATIVISLVDDLTDAAVLGFERASYLGIIENNAATIEPIVLNEGYTTAVIFTLHGDLSDAAVLGFERASYLGIIENNAATIEPIVLNEGYTTAVIFTLHGDLSNYFNIVQQGSSVSIVLQAAIPEQSIPANRIVLLELRATSPGAIPAVTAVVFEVVRDDDVALEELVFSAPYYTGQFSEAGGLVFETAISLDEGYDQNVQFALDGEHAQWFTLVVQGNSVTLTTSGAIPPAVIANNQQLVFVITADKPNSNTARATIVISLVDDLTDAAVLGFERASYLGIIENNAATIEPIVLNEGYTTAVIFTLHGDLSNYFNIVQQGSSVSIVLQAAIPEQSIPANRIVLLELRATSPGTIPAVTAVVFEVVREDVALEELVFSAPYYTGQFSEAGGLVFETAISLDEGYDQNVQFALDGEHAQWFTLVVQGNLVTLTTSGAIPPAVIANNQQLVFVITAEKPNSNTARATIVISLINGLETETESFGQVLYEGTINVNVVQHESITVTGYTGSTVEILGDYRHLFAASLTEGAVVVAAVGNLALPDDVSHVPLELRAGAAKTPELPTVIFGSPSYVLRADMAQTGVQLTVEVTATCGDDDHALPPLIILDRDEEEPHDNLVVLDSATQSGCTYRLTNRWPPEHDWLYVDENGLHARRIDREDPRIAFMALSQIQVELVLECPSDTQTRVKRSLSTSSRHDLLGPYDYGSNKWILTDTILYNSRRSFVNLIVNDINDNYPVFIGYENEPIVVGYPIPELEEVVLPRALVELKATDADVGENAQLQFWSPEPVLAVASSTGSVHVRDGATLTDEEVLTVSVTDLNGREDGLTTSMELMVKLIDTRHIAVVTVRNAFLDHEDNILSNLTAAVGYEVKVLSSAVISDDTDTSSANARNKREVTSEGASLQLYVYGLIDREPVAVERLSTRKARNYEQFSDANSLASRNEPLEDLPKVESLKKPRLNLEELKRSERRLQEMLEAPIEDTTVKPSTSDELDPSGAFDTIINMAPPDIPMPIVIQSIDRLKDNATSEDEDEFGERANKSRRKSVVTFNENVEKIIHVEDIPDDNSSDLEIFKF